MDSDAADSAASARIRVENKSGIDPQLWHACAGGAVHLPQINSRVFYFPQGHAEHSGIPDLSLHLPPSFALGGYVICRITGLQYLADLETDEVFTRISLVPEDPTHGVLPQFLPAKKPPIQAPNISTSPPDKPSFFAKTLTQSDANNGGGFSVPRYCAETILPSLDYSKEPPVQSIFASDVHGEVWKFRHIYRGTPRRHLLTTGWSSFVNQKKLVAGDSIVFLRNTNGELRIGIRRSNRCATMADQSPAPSIWHRQTTPTSLYLQTMQPHIWDTPNPYKYTATLGGAGRGGEAKAGGTGTSLRPETRLSHNRPQMSRAAVIDAAINAAMGKPFEVIYYPRSSIYMFCVDADLVMTSVKKNLSRGMRFKMPVETEDSSRTSWYMGTISEVHAVDPIRWPDSFWKTIEVTWDESELLQGITRVNSWQIEPVLPMQMLPLPIPKKKFRASSNLQALDGHEFMFPSPTCNTAAVPDTVVSGGQLNPWQPRIQDSFPASFGMQGARHDHLYGFQSTPNKAFFLDRLHSPSNNFSNYNNAYHAHHPHLGSATGASVSMELQMSTASPSLQTYSSRSENRASTSMELQMSTAPPPLQTYSSGSGYNLSGLNSEEGEPSVSLPVPNNPHSKRTQFRLFGTAIDVTTIPASAKPEEEPELEPSSHTLSDAGNNVAATKEGQNEQKGDSRFIWLQYGSDHMNATAKSESVSPCKRFNSRKNEAGGSRENEEAGDWTQLGLSL